MEDAVAAAARGEGKTSPGTEAAAVCLGAIASGEIASAVAAGSASVYDLPPIAELAVTALLGLSVNRYEAVAFTVGAALVEACGGPPAPLPSSAAGNKLLHSMLGDAAAGDGGGGGGAPLLQRQRLSYTTGAPIGEDEAELRDVAVSTVLAGVLDGPLHSLRAVERTSAAVYLLSMTHGLSRSSPALTGRLPDLQAAFTRLLGE